jgi:hypothetical protein
MSLAVTVREPAARRVTLNPADPEERGALGGRRALRSLEEIETRSLVAIRFQFASTALMVTGNGLPAV